MENSRNPFAEEVSTQKAIVADFETKSQKIASTNPMLQMRGEPEFAKRWADSEHFKRLSKAEQKAFLAAKKQQDGYVPYDKAADALSEDFNTVRTELNANTELVDSRLKKIIQIIKAWLDIESAGSVNRYLAMLDEGSKTELKEDQLASLHNLVETLNQLLAGLSTSAPGRELLNSKLFDSKEKGWWNNHIIRLAEKAADNSGKTLNNYNAQMAARYRTAESAEISLTNTINRFFSNISATTHLAQGMIAIGRNNATADQLAAFSTMQHLARMAGVEITLAETTVGNILHNAQADTASIVDWNKSPAAKYYGTILNERVPIATATKNREKLNNYGKLLDQSVGGIALSVLAASAWMESDGVKSVLLRSNASISVAESISNSLAIQGAALIENIAKLARRDLDAIIAKNASRIVNYYGGNSSSMSTTISSSVESRFGVKGLAFAKSMIKVGGILGVIDIAAKVFQSNRLSNRGDYDAAAYAATGAVGGMAMLAFAFAGPVGIIIGLTGVAISIVSGVKLTQAIDSGIEAWVKGGFWGGKPSGIFDRQPKYYYWGNIDRLEIEAILDNKKLTEFDSQLEIAKLITNGKAKALSPNVNEQQVSRFFIKEVAGLNDILYMPRISQTNETVQIALPNYSHEHSLLEVIFQVTESIGSHRDGARRKQTYTKNYHLDSNSEFWVKVNDKPGTFKIAIGLFKEHFGIRKTYYWDNDGALNFTYYPLGKNDDQNHYDPKIDSDSERVVEMPNPMIQGSYKL